MMRLLAILFAILTASVAARADIAFVAASDLGDNNGTSSSLSVTFDATGANLLIIAAEGDAPVAQGGGAADDITAPTYAGVSATLITKYVATTTTNTRFNYLYYVLHPATSSNSLAISSTASHWLSLMVASYSGVGSSGTIPGASSASSDTSSNDTYASSLSTAPDRAWVMLQATSSGGVTTPNCSSGGIARTYEVRFQFTVLCDSNGFVTPPQSYSMNATINANSNFQSHLMASFGPDLGGGLMMRGCCN